MKTFIRVCLGISLISVGIGFGLIVLAAGTRFGLREASTYSFEDSKQDVQALDLDIGYGEVTIVEGDEFHIDAQNVLETFDLESEVSNGVWRIALDADRNIGIFGLNFPMITVFGENLSPDITITVPEGFVSKNTDIQLGAGRLDAEVIRAENGTFQVDAGELRVEELTVSNNSKFNVGAGYMNLEKVELNNIIAECSVGYIGMQGKITGDNDIICNVGQIKLDLDGSKENYSYDIDSDIGNVIINDRSYHKREISKSAGEKVEGSFNLSCDIGNITLEIYE